MGIGSGNVESMTSYLARLAEAHSMTLGSLISCEIAPILCKKYLTQSTLFGGSRFYENSAALLGMGMSANDIVNIMEILTGRHDLQSLTLLPWGQVLGPRKLIKHTRAWCPVCLSRWKEKEAEIYEPLLWSLQIVQNCLVHRVELCTMCPSCGLENFLISRRSRVGYCNKCGCFLGSDSGAKVGPRTEWDGWVAENVSNLVSTLPSKTETYCYSDMISDVINVHFSGSQKAFGRAIDLPLSSIRSWRSGVKPSLDQILALTYRLGLPLKSVFMGRDISLIKLRRVEAQSVKRIRRPFEYEKVRAFLELKLSDDKTPPTSMRQMASEVGYDKRVLYKYFPDMCKKNSAKYLKFLSEQKARRIDASKADIEAAAEALCRVGGYPSRRKIEFLLKPSILRERELQLAWKAVKNKLVENR